jgi:hypothetical protein
MARPRNSTSVIIGRVIKWGIVTIAAVLVLGGVCFVINPVLRSILETFHNLKRGIHSMGFSSEVVGLASLALVIIGVVGIAKMALNRSNRYDDRRD